MSTLSAGRGVVRRSAGVTAIALGAAAFAAQTPIEQTMPLVWVITGIAAGGAVITFAFLFYSIWRYRDPATRRRRYG